MQHCVVGNAAHLCLRPFHRRGRGIHNSRPGPLPAIGAVQRVQQLSHSRQQRMTICKSAWQRQPREKRDQEQMKQNHDQGVLSQGIPPGTRLIPITFMLQREVDFGHSHKLVGSHISLGEWNVRDAQQMEWGKGHVWRAEVPLPAGTVLEFKLVRVIVGQEDGYQEWEKGPNHSLYIPPSGVSSMAVQVAWGGDVVVTAKQAQQGHTRGTAVTTAARMTPDPAAGAIRGGTSEVSPKRGGAKQEDWLASAQTEIEKEPRRGSPAPVKLTARQVQQRGEEERVKQKQVQRRPSVLVVIGSVLVVFGLVVIVLVLVGVPPGMQSWCDSVLGSCSGWGEQLGSSWRQLEGGVAEQLKQLGVLAGGKLEAMSAAAGDGWAQLEAAAGEKLGGLTTVAEQRLKQASTAAAGGFTQLGAMAEGKLEELGKRWDGVTTAAEQQLKQAGVAAEGKLDDIKLVIDGGLGHLGGAAIERLQGLQRLSMAAAKQLQAGGQQLLAAAKTLADWRG